jgi:hypothetical protein
VKLAAPDMTIPPSFREALKNAKGSAAGYSAVSEWLTCPEKSRLRATGVRRRNEYESGDDELSALAFGTLCHLLRAVRVVRGHDGVEQALEMWRGEMPYGSWLKARFMFRTYESLYPRDADTFEYLGVEAEVITDVGRALGLGKSIMRTVRYDTVARVPGVGGTPPELFTFECKTMARAGQSSIDPYMPQAMSQVALWNSNPNLVSRYGRMAGIIFDCLVKTAAPNVERYGPIYFGRIHQKLALEYLALADSGGVTFGKQGAGDEPAHFPRMLHSCWGRYRACEYISLCHENSVGEFTNADGSPYEGSE